MLYMVYATKIHVPWPINPFKGDVAKVFYPQNEKGIVLIHYFVYTGVSWLYYDFELIDPSIN